ncbi:MAG: hypothetical protein N3G76_02660 [Candidatus Micrarchaeota archaeon]|nr:hypothetical protein [Candidatus Micrarchaeota archaeon]
MVLVCPLDIDPQTGYFAWIPIVALLFTIVFLILSLLYIAAKLLSRADWEARVKVEAARMVVSLVFILGIVVFAEIMCTASASITDGADPFIAAKNYISIFAIQIIPKALSTIWASAIDARIAATLITPLPSCMSGICYNEDAAAVYIANNLESIANISMPFAASLIVQMLALDIIKQFFLALLLPAGFILKILPATRDAGAYLISIALAFYFVFPLAYFMGGMIHKEIGKSTLNAIKESITSSNLGNAYSFDNGESLKAVVDLAYVAPYAVTIPLLAVILSLAAARSLFPVFSRDFIGEVGM